MDVTTKVLGLSEYDGNAVDERIEKIILHPDRSFTFVFYDGTEIKTFYEGSRGFGKKRKSNPGE